MKRTLIFCSALLCFVNTATAATYSVDPDHTKVGFKVRHMGISWVPGIFTKLEGTFSFDEKNIAASSAQATIDTKSVDTQSKKRDDHLRGDEFFASDKFPEIKFASKQIKDVAGSKFKVIGDLTIHGVTKPVELDVEYTGSAKDPWGNERSAFTASTKLNRKDYGLQWSKLLETGALLVGDDVYITVEVEGIKKAG